MEDVLFYLDRILVPYEPSLVVVYEGDNDLAAGMTVDEVHADFARFIDLMKENLPATDLAFISVKPSPSRSHLMSDMRDFNHRLERLAAESGSLFIDVFHPMLDSSGNPMPQLFTDDNLHLNAGGYRLWKKLLEPVLMEWKNQAAGSLEFSGVSLEGAKIRFQWKGSGQLQYADSAQGPWMPMASSEPNQFSDEIQPVGQRFYRLVGN